MRLKVSISIYCVLIMLLCSACFDIDEQLTMKKNGSGDYAITVSMERFINEVKDYAEDHPESVQADEDNSEQDFSSYNSILNDKKKLLESIQGISNVNTNFDSTKYAISIGFHFGDIQALNRGLAAAQLFTTIDNTTLPQDFKYFEWKEGVLQRHEDPNFKRSFQLPTSKVSPNADMKGMDMSMFLQDVSYTTHYVFERKLKSVNQRAINSDVSSTAITQKIFPFQSSKLGANSLETSFEFVPNKKSK